MALLKFLSTTALWEQEYIAAALIMCTLMCCRYFEGMKDFSTCSLDEFKYLSTGRDLGCLQDWPVERKPRRRPRRICGNGVLEGNEQCDCGTLKVGILFFSNSSQFLMCSSKKTEKLYLFLRFEFDVFLL